MIRLLLLVLSVLLVACSGGGGRPEAETVRTTGLTVGSMVVVRAYGWDATISEPQAVWNPVDNRLLVRSAVGLALLREGAGAQEYYRLAEGRSAWNPAWLSRTSIVFGSDPIPSRGADGSVILPESGLFRSDILATGLQEPQEWVDEVYCPRPWGDQVVGQWGEEVLLVDAEGEREPFGLGFFPEPQLGGPGLAWQTKPLVHQDLWSGGDGIGDLVIRWGPGTVDVIPGGLEPRWTADGGLICTQLRGPIPPGQDWTAAGTDVVRIDGPGETPRLVLTGGHSPDPHPNGGFAAVLPGSGIVLASDDGRAQQRIARKGVQPRWNARGDRLLIEEPGQPIPYLRVLVLRGSDEPTFDD